VHDSNYREFKKRYIKALDKSLNLTGFLLVNTATLLAPVDTGRLRQTIGYVVNPFKISVKFGSNVFYDIFIEKGTSRQKAQPYIKPSLLRNVEQIEEIIKKVFRGEL